MKKKFFLNTAVLVFFAFHTGCSKSETSPVIARVGKTKFTVDDLIKNIPAEYREHITKEQNINYVKQWMDTELLFQEALRKKIDKDPQIRNRMKKMQKDLLAAEIINRLSLENQKTTFDNSAIRDFYSQHQKEFLREADKYKYLEIVVDDQKVAWYIRNTLNNLNFDELASQYSKIPSTGNMNLSYVALNELPSDIQSAITSASLEVNTLPIKTDFGYHVFRVIDRLKKGEVCTEDEVKDEIINRLTNLSQKENMEKLISDLRLKTDIQFNLDLIKESYSDSLN